MRRKNRNLILISAFFLVIILFILINFLIKINKVLCKSDGKECRREITKDLEGLKGKSYFLAKARTKDVFKNNLWVKDFKISFSFPDRLVIDLKEQIPFYSVRIMNDERFFLVSKEGVVLSFVDQTTLPVVDVLDMNLNLGDKIDDRVFFALNLTYLVSKAYRFEKAQLNNNFLLIELKHGPRVIFPLEGDREYLVGALVLVNNQLNKDSLNFKIGNKSLVEIDLRFENPVIRKIN